MPPISPYLPPTRNQRPRRHPSSDIPSAGLDGCRRCSRRARGPSGPSCPFARWPPRTLPRPPSYPAAAPRLRAQPTPPGASLADQSAAGEAADSSLPPARPLAAPRRAGSRHPACKASPRKQASLKIKPNPTQPNPRACAGAGAPLSGGDHQPPARAAPPGHAVWRVGPAADRPPGEPPYLGEKQVRPGKRQRPGAAPDPPRPTRRRRRRSGRWRWRMRRTMGSKQTRCRRS